MPRFRCGDPVRYGKFDGASSGCLVRFVDRPDRLLLLTAGHAVLPTFAKQGDPITGGDGDDVIGQLHAWTPIDGDPTADAALIWVDPDKVDPSLGTLGTMAGIAAPVVGQAIQTASRPLRGDSTDPRIATVRADMAGVRVLGPGWPAAPSITYRGQVIADKRFAQVDDSGCIAVDAQLRAIGMVVGGGGDLSGGFTMITPMSALLAAASWGGRGLELVADFKASDFVAPPATSAARSARASLLATPASTSAALDADTRRAITAAMRHNEIGDATPYQVSFAGKGSSGASFGAMQGDLAAGQADVTATFMQALAAAGVPIAKAQAMLAALSVHLVDNPLSIADTQLVDAALASAAGRALVDQMDQKILGGVCHGVDDCLQAATGSGRAVALEAILYMAMWINMSGAPTKLLAWLKGGIVVLGKSSVGPAPLQVDGAAMQAYLRQTPYFVANPKNLAHLVESAAAGLRGQA